jgi:outer membrane receptor protein involved in Fe transport
MKSFTRMLTRIVPIVLLLVAPAFSAELHGTVTATANQAPLPGASVELHGPSGLRLATVTDAQGVFRFPDVGKSIRYTVYVSAQGFKPLTQEIQLSSDSQRLDISLDLTTVLESVVVKGSGEVISVVSNAPDISQTIPQEEVAELPTANRNVTKYALLNPHVRMTQGLGSDGNNGNRISINGQSSRHTAYVTDGVINYDWVYANGPFQLVSASAVEDVSVLTNQYAAEYGTTTAGIVKINTQSGSNQLGGEAFAFVIPSGIQARPPVATFHIPNEREQWGGLLGGALVKDKTFFFVSYEGIRQVRGSFIQSPTPGFFVGQGDEVYGLARLDQNFSDNHAISVRLNGYHYRNTNANDRVGGFNQISFGRVERSQSWGGQVADRLVIGHNMLNYLRVNYSVFSPDNNTPTGAFSPAVGINRPSYSVSGFSQFNWDRTKLVDISDTLAFNHGRHNLKFGAEFVHLAVRDDLFSLFGTYNFAAGPPTAGQNPLNYTQTFGNANLSFGENTFQGFAQDDFKITSRLSGNLGVRYEYQSTTDSLHRLAPRVGFAWDVRGDGKTRVTAGAGLFYDQIPLIQLRDALRNGVGAPLLSYTIPFGVAGFPTFPNSLTSPPTSVAAARLDLTIRPPQYLNPYSFQSSIGVERDLGHRFVLLANGIYTHTVHQLRNFDINHPSPFVRTAPGQVRSGAAADATRPFTTYQGLPVRRVVMFQNTNSSTYGALDVGVRRLFARRIQTEAHYVWAESVTYGIFDNFAPSDWGDENAAERGPSDFYQRHRFIENAIFELPYGFKFSEVVTVGSGLPVNPLTGTDNNGDSFATDRPVGFKRDSFRTPKQAQVDVSLSKVFTVTESLRLQARAEAFNLFNHDNYFTVNNIYGNGATPNATFLKPVAGIANVDPARRIQFGLRILFGRRSVRY